MENIGRKQGKDLRIGAYRLFFLSPVCGLRSLVSLPHTPCSAPFALFHILIYLWPTKAR